MRCWTTSWGFGGFLTVGGTFGGFSRAGRKRSRTRGASGRGSSAIVAAGAVRGATAAAPPAEGRSSPVAPTVSAHSKAMSPGRSIDGTILFQAPRVTPCGRAERGHNTVTDATPHDARTPLRQVHLPQGRPGLAPARRRGTASRQAGVRGRLRGLRPDRGPSAAVLLVGRHAWGLRSHAPDPVAQPGPCARVPRPPRPEWTDEMVVDPVLLSGDDQAVGVLGAVPARRAPAARRVPVRLPVRADPRLAPPPAGRAPADRHRPH